MSTRRPRRQRGLSMIELIIFMVVMGVAATAVLSIMNIASKNSADPLRHKQALLLAEAYLEEVELARFTFCDPTDTAALTAPDTASCSAGKAEGIGTEAGEIRPFDNVSDYATAFDTPQQNFKNAAGNLTDVNGTEIDAIRLGDYTVTVQLSAVPAGLGPSGHTIVSGQSPSAMNVLRITVQVQYGSKSASETVTLDGYRTRYAPNSLP